MEEMDNENKLNDDKKDNDEKPKSPSQIGKNNVNNQVKEISKCTFIFLFILYRY